MAFICPVAACVSGSANCYREELAYALSRHGLENTNPRRWDKESNVPNDVDSILSPHGLSQDER